MLRKRILKILSVLVAVIIAFSCLITVSAAENVEVIKSYSDFFSLDSVKFYYLPKDSAEPVDYTSNISFESNTKFIRFKLLDELSFKRDSKFKLSLVFSVNDKYLKRGFTSGSFNITRSDNSPKLAFLTNQCLSKNVNFGLYSQTYSSSFKRLYYEKIVAVIPENDVSGTFDKMQLDIRFTNNSLVTSSDIFCFNFTGLNLDYEDTATGEIGFIIQDPGNFFYQSLNFVTDILGIIRANIALVAIVICIPIVSFTFLLLRKFIHNN